MKIHVAINLEPNTFECYDVLSIQLNKPKR